MQEKPSPTALILGWGGVIPFVATALAFHYGPAYIAITALETGTIYGAVIITFIGAVHWGVALQRDQGHPFFLFLVGDPVLTDGMRADAGPGLSPCPSGCRAHPCLGS